MSVRLRKSLSKSLGIGTFFLLLLLQKAFPQTAVALSSVDACTAQPTCAAALGTEVSSAVAAPTAEGVGATITAVAPNGGGGIPTLVKAAAGVVVAGTTYVATQQSVADDTGTISWYYWSYELNQAAQELAKQRFCATYPTDYVCTPFTGGQGAVYSVS